jgi:hypothetical protein|tara:strand:+ start:531 stop:1235 length:705 start_codon:yes stop_codon:yes gene_type:complete
MSLSLNDYCQLHTAPLIPLDICVNCEEFNLTMKKYELAFRRWGEDHYDKRRFALPLVNLSGHLSDNPDPSMIPLDVYNRNRTKKIWDNDFTMPTSVLSEPCFEVLAPIKPYLIRSSILKWFTGSLFYPHIDTWIPSPILRLWGTDDPDNTSLRFNVDNIRSAHVEVSPGIFTEPAISVEEASKNLVRAEGIEAGRMYLIDTAIAHDAHSHGDNVHQFFLALNVNSIATVKTLVL